jgi:hypothetical protein
MTPLPHLDGARDAASPDARLRAVRDRARALHAELLAAQPVAYYRSFDLVRVPYPTRYALLNAATAPTPFVHILNRLTIVQYREGGRVRTLLAGPTDVDASRATPYFRRLARSFGPLEKALTPMIGPVLGSVEAALRTAGLAPAQVDWISYDHLHTQDLRRWLGPGGLFPNARLLVMRAEWESARGLLPTQRDWYCPGGTDGVDPDRVVCLDRDVLLGEGVALVRTPGHTAGNHSFAVRTPEGVMVSSENGVGADAWAPLHSRIPGVRRYAEATGCEVVLNGNTLEGAVDQYLSMVLEKELAGPSARDERFPNCVSSSELTGFWLFPGVTPTFTFGELAFGAPVVTQ